MDLKTAMAKLKSAGTAQNRKIYARHGAGPEQFGVSFGDLGKLAKSIGKDNGLAKELWATGNSDAMILATMIADPARIGKTTLDSWVRDVHYYQLASYVAKVAAESPHAMSLMEKWTASKKEFVSQTGWDVLSLLAIKDSSLDEEMLRERLARIESGIHGSENRTRYAMNSALIAIGRRDPALKKVALEAAKRIGTVHVDHGETGCKTPDAISYIKKPVPKRGKAAKK